MSEQILGTATVVVQADTSRFRAELTAVLAEATRKPVVVNVVPTNTGFLKELNRQIKELQNIKPVQIPIESNAAGFVTKLNADLKALGNLKPVQVLVEPDLRGFRTKLQAEVKAASEGVVANVGVVPTPGTRAATAAAATSATRGGGGASRAKTAEDALNEAINAGVASRRKLDQSLSVEEKRLARLSRQKVALKASEDALTLAVRRGTAAQQEAAEKEVARNRAAVQATEGVIDRANAQKIAAERRRAESAQRIADAEKEAKALADADKRSLQEREAFEQQHRAAERARSSQRIADLQKEIAVQLRRDAVADAARSKQQTDKIGRAQAEAITRNREIIRLEDQIVRARERVAAVDRAGATAKTAVQAAEREAGAAARASAAANKLFEGSIQKATNAQRAQLVSLVQTTAALEAYKAESLRTARADALRTKQHQSVTRAIVAQTLQLIGLRGAALSADLPFLAAAASVIAFAAALKTAADFESNLSVFGVTAGATADQLEEVSDAARRLGADITLPSVGATDAAKAMLELSKAGLGVEDSMDAARGVLQLATAAGIENAQATELAANALNAFGLAGDQAVRVADVLANAANDAQGSITDIGTALSQSASVARQAGLSLEQTVAALTLFARNGLRGSDAGTSFRTMLLRLINPTDKAAAVIRKLGLDVRTSTGEINLEVFDQFTEATKGMSKAARDQALAIIFGQDAIRGAAILAREGSDAFNEQVDSLGKAGTAAELANARMVGLTGAVENVKNQFSSLALTVGQVGVPVITDLTNAIAGGVQTASSLVEALIKINKEVKDFENNIANLPQPKIGPFDFSENDKQFVDFIKGLPERSAAIVSPVLPAAKPFLEAAFDATKLKGDAREVGRQVKEILDDARALDAQGLKFVPTGEAIERLDELIDKLNNGDVEAQILAASVLKVKDSLLQANKVPPFNFPRIDVPDELQTGAAGEAVGDAQLNALERTMSGAEIFKISYDAFSNVEFGITAALNAARERIQDALNSIGRTARLRLARLRSDMLDIELEGGDPKSRIRNLRQQEKRAQTLVDLAEERKLPQAEIDRRKQDLIDIKDQIEAAQGEIDAARDKAISDREERANKAKQARNEADQAFFDSLIPAQSKVQQRSIRAANTARLEDDKAALVAERDLILREIALIDQQVKDKKKAAQEIDSRRTEIVRLNGEIAQKEEEIRDSNFERTQGRLGRRQQALADFGDIKGQIRIINRRIAEYNKLLRTLKGEREVFQKYIDEREALRRERAQLEEDERNQAIELGQAIFDLTGNRNPLVQALDAAIRDTQKQIAAAKKAGRSTTGLRTELLRLLKQRKDVLEEAKDEAESQGTTAFDLLQSAAETFRATGGNLIGGNQPFAGPTGFTADLAQFLRRQKSSSQQFKIDTSDVPGRAIDRQIKSNTDLIAAINDLTDVIVQTSGGRRGNRSTVSTATSRNDRAHFPEATEARRVVERRSGI